MQRTMILMLAVAALLACSACNDVMGPVTNDAQGDRRGGVSDKRDDVSPAKEELDNGEGGGGGGEITPPTADRRRHGGGGEVTPSKQEMDNGGGGGGGGGEVTPPVTQRRRAGSAGEVSPVDAQEAR
jgi:hypothetical protein